MIIVRLIGGLGNQLFQYAAGRRLSLLRGDQLKLDITSYESDRQRTYSLNPFRIQEVFASPQEIARLKGSSRITSLMRRAVQELKPRHRRAVFSESRLRPYDSNILRTPRNVYLAGYWQSEKYFIDIQDVIRSEFTVKLAPDNVSVKLAEEISSVQSVSIHVRRGDFVRDQGVNRIHGICELDYYKQSVRLITDRVSSPHFFVFSDDPEWVRENLQLPHPVAFVTHNGAARDYEDLRLMSLCRHNVAANSSFSWWGAWLNVNPTKTVVAPRQWFRGTSIDTRDLLPAGWIVV